MDRDEAIAWIKGERSMCNIIPSHNLDTWQVRIAQADAAMVQQAYWVLKAHAEGLVNGKPLTEKGGRTEPTT